jgi:hypothetical protein
MAASDSKLHLGETFPNGARHICAFFRDKDEEFRRLRPFILEGLERGEKALHMVNANNRTAHLNRLHEAGIDVEAAEERGQLQVLSWPDSYLRGGHFDQDDAIELIEGLLAGARADGFPRSRWIGDMDWALENRVSVADLMLFEARLNTLLSKNDDIVICVYDLSRFSGATVIDALRTHPVVIIEGITQVNPFFVSPETFIAEVRKKRRLESGPA